MQSFELHLTAEYLCTSVSQVIETYIAKVSGVRVDHDIVRARVQIQEGNSSISSQDSNFVSVTVDVAGDYSLLRRELRQELGEVVVPEPDLPFISRAGHEVRISIGVALELQKALDHGALFVELDYLIYLSRVKVNDVKPDIKTQLARVNAKA